ncbi:putative reverse transcriptase domain-containing protein [Tanacetum coccineum]
MSVMLPSDATFSMEIFPFGHCPEGNGDVSSVCFVRENNNNNNNNNTEEKNEDGGDELDNVNTDGGLYGMLLRGKPHGYGIHVDPAKIESIKNWAVHTTLTEIRQFLGLAEYYRRFIEDEDEEEAFQLLKEKLCSTPILALLDGNKDFVVLLHTRFGDSLDAETEESRDVISTARKLLSDYDCEIRYHPGKANVVADSLSRKERLKPLRVRSLGMMIISPHPSQILEAQTEAVKEENVKNENLCGMIEKKFQKRPNRTICFEGRSWIPLYGGVWDLIMHESHKLKYSIYPGFDKMYHDLKELYWWSNMKEDIVIYISKCLTCSKVKAGCQKPSRLLQQPEIPVLLLN